MQPKDRRLVTEKNLEHHTETALAPIRSEASQALFSSRTAIKQSDTAMSRVEQIETVAGLAPGEVTDAQTANLLEQPNTLTRQQFDTLLADKADDWRQVEETDYVDMLRKMSYYDEISVVKTSEGFDVSLKNSSFIQQIGFVKPDDYFKMSGIRLTSDQYIPTNRQVSVTDLTYTGNWLLGDKPADIRYAREIGATAEYTFQTPATVAIKFRHLSDNRGGILRFTRNGGDPVEISTYAATAVTETVTIYTDVPPGDHTIRVEFLGDDPAHPPAGGTSRGWITSQALSDGSPVYVFDIQGEELSGGDNVLLMSDTSNKEFAFSITPEGGTASEWVPYHGTATAFSRSEPVFILDGVQYLLSELQVGQEYSCQDFKFIQDIYGRHSETGDTNLVNIKTIHSITQDGNINISGSMSVLQDIQIGASYVIMAPVNNGVFDVLQTGWGNKYAATKTDGSSTVLPEGAQCGNYIFLAQDQDYYVAFRHTDQRGNFDHNGTAEKGYYNFLNHRDELIVKHYIRIFGTPTLPAGYKYRWSGDYIAGKLRGAYDLMSS